MSERTVRVLYIDDDDGIRRLAGRALTRRGFEVVAAEDGERGLELATSQFFDVIAVDHYMPGLDGLETLGRLRQLPDGPPVVYVTGSDEGRIAVAALKAGAADYVVKTVGDDFFDLLAAAFGSVCELAALTCAKATAEEELRASNARLEALLGEVNHRVANSLQLVSAMVRLQAGGLADGAARSALDDTQRRIGAIAQVHRRLYTSNDVESVDMREYLRALVDELAEAWSSDAGERRLALVAEPIRLATDKAVSLGVIVTELVTNAIKYAYADNAGEIRVRLTREGDDLFLLVVEDDGCGVKPGAAPRGTGVGTKVINAMARSLQSVVQYDPAHRGCRVLLRAAAH
ncbi:MAG: response regulator [Sphingomonas sp.]|nr:MAG: response regulator [Sphingomonas sp.]